MMKYFGMPIQASAHAAEIDQMTSLVHGLMLVLFIGWGLYFAFVLFRFRRGANPTASYAGAKGKLVIVAAADATPGNHNLAVKATATFNGQKLTADQVVPIVIEKVEQTK